MRCDFSFCRFPPSFILMILLTGILLTGCVTPIPLAQEAPDLSYKTTNSLVVAVIDERDILAQGKPPTYIGRAHGTFGIPSDMQTYPWFVSDKNKKEQTLAEALEERIVVGLNDEGWQSSAAGYTTRPTKDEAVSLLATHSAKHLLTLSITKWFVSINLNWVSAFNFDWGYKLEVLDAQGVVVTHISDSGRDEVDEEAKQSFQNLIKLAYRERLIKILERPEVRAALQSGQNTQLSQRNKEKSKSELTQECIDSCTSATSKNPEACFDLCAN